MNFVLMGYPASGKSSVAREYEAKGYIILNRDAAGGKVIDLLPKWKDLLKAGKKVLLDNTFPTIESRKPFIDVTDLLGLPITCLWLTTTIEQAQFNACTRMIRKHGHLLTPVEIKAAKNPNTYPPVVLFKYKKEFEKPTTAEGFEKIEKLPFVFVQDPAYKKAATIFDFDGTLRITKSGDNWPVDPSDIEVLPGRKEKLKQLRQAGDQRILGASNQSGIGKGNLTEVQANTCFTETILQLGVDIDYMFCPHRIPPITCWCRKPMCGLGVHFIEKYKLDRSKVVVVGDMTSDCTFAKRCGFNFVWAHDFFV